MIDKNKNYEFFSKINRVIFYEFTQDSLQEILKIIKAFNSKQKEFLINFILWNKLSNIFLNNFSIDTLKIYFKESQLKKISFQQKRFQIHSLLIAQEIKLLSKYLQEKNTLGIFLKGSGLSIFEYHDISLRPMMDIDLFIEEKKIYDFYTFLNEQGYKHSLKKKFVLNENEFRETLCISHQIPTLHSKSGVAIELHSRVTHREEFPKCPLTHEVIENFQQKKYKGSNISVPSPEDMFKLQLAHMCSYPFFKMVFLNFFDLKNLKQNYDLNISKICNDVTSKKIQKEIFLVSDLLYLIDNTISNQNLSFVSSFKDNLFNTETKRLEQALDRIYTFPNSKFGKSHFIYLLGTSRNFFDFQSRLISKIFPNKTLLKNKLLISGGFFQTIKVFFLNTFINLKKYSKDIMIISLKFIFSKKEIRNYQEFAAWLQKEE